MIDPEPQMKSASIVASSFDSSSSNNNIEIPFCPTDPSEQINNGNNNSHDNDDNNEDNDNYNMLMYVADDPDGVLWQCNSSTMSSTDDDNNNNNNNIVEDVESQIVTSNENDENTITIQSNNESSNDNDNVNVNVSVNYTSNDPCKLKEKIEKNNTSTNVTAIMIQNNTNEKYETSNDSKKKSLANANKIEIQPNRSVSTQPNRSVSGIIKSTSTSTSSQQNSNNVLEKSIGIGKNPTKSEAMSTAGVRFATSTTTTTLREKTNDSNTSNNAADVSSAITNRQKINNNNIGPSSTKKNQQQQQQQQQGGGKRLVLSQKEIDNILFKSISVLKQHNELKQNSGKVMKQQTTSKCPSIDSTTFGLTKLNPKLVGETTLVKNEKELVVDLPLTTNGLQVINQQTLDDSYKAQQQQNLVPSNHWISRATDVCRQFLNIDTSTTPQQQPITTAAAITNTNTFDSSNKIHNTTSSLPYNMVPINDLLLNKKLSKLQTIVDQSQVTIQALHTVHANIVNKDKNQLHTTLSSLSDVTKIIQNQIHQNNNELVVLQKHLEQIGNSSSSTIINKQQQQQQQRTKTNDTAVASSKQNAEPDTGKSSRQRKKRSNNSSTKLKNSQIESNMNTTNDNNNKDENNNTNNDLRSLVSSVYDDIQKKQSLLDRVTNETRLLSIATTVMNNNFQEQKIKLLGLNNNINNTNEIETDAAGDAAATSGSTDYSSVASMNRMIYDKLRTTFAKPTSDVSSSSWYKKMITIQEKLLDIDLKANTIQDDMKVVCAIDYPEQKYEQKLSTLIKNLISELNSIQILVLQQQDQIKLNEIQNDCIIQQSMMTKINEIITNFQLRASSIERTIQQQQRMKKQTSLTTKDLHSDATNTSNPIVLQSNCDEERDDAATSIKGNDDKVFEKIEQLESLGNESIVLKYSDCTVHREKLLNEVMNHFGIARTQILDIIQHINDRSEDKCINESFGDSKGRVSKVNTIVTVPNKHDKAVEPYKLLEEEIATRASEFVTVKKNISELSLKLYDTVRELSSCTISDDKTKVYDSRVVAWNSIFAEIRCSELPKLRNMLKKFTKAIRSSSDPQEMVTKLLIIWDSQCESTKTSIQYQLNEISQAKALQREAHAEGKQTRNTVQHLMATRKTEVETLLSEVHDHQAKVATIQIGLRNLSKTKINDTKLYAWGSTAKSRLDRIIEILQGEYETIKKESIEQEAQLRKFVTDISMLQHVHMVAQDVIELKREASIEEIEKLEQKFVLLLEYDVPNLVLNDREKVKTALQQELAVRMQHRQRYEKSRKPTVSVPTKTLDVKDPSTDDNSKTEAVPMTKSTLQAVNSVKNEIPATKNIDTIVVKVDSEVHRCVDDETVNVLEGAETTIMYNVQESNNEIEVASVNEPICPQTAKNNERNEVVENNTAGVQIANMLVSSSQSTDVKSDTPVVTLAKEPDNIQLNISSTSDGIAVPVVNKKKFRPSTREKFHDSSYEVSSLTQTNSSKKCRPRLITTNPVVMRIKQSIMSQKIDELQEGFEIPFDESGLKINQSTTSIQLTSSLPSVGNPESNDGVFEVPFDESGENDKTFGHLRSETQQQPISCYTPPHPLNTTNIDVDICNTLSTGITIDPPAHDNTIECPAEYPVALGPCDRDTIQPKSNPASADKNTANLLTPKKTRNSYISSVIKTGGQMLTKSSTAGTITTPSKKYKTLLDEQKLKATRMMGLDTDTPPCEIVTSPKNGTPRNKSRPSYLPSPKRFLSHSISSTSSISSASSV